jgi:hypothetical protein
VIAPSKPDWVVIGGRPLQPGTDAKVLAIQLVAQANAGVALVEFSLVEDGEDCVGTDSRCAAGESLAFGSVDLLGQYQRIVHIGEHPPGEHCCGLRELGAVPRSLRELLNRPLGDCCMPHPVTVQQPSHR